MKKGISLVSLVVVIIIITILAGLITTGAVSSIKAVNLNKFGVEILNIQTKVNEYYYKYGTYPSGTDAVFSTYDLDEETLIQFNTETITDNKITLKVLDIVGLGIEESTFGKNPDTIDTYAISHVTGKVYYLKGVDYDGKTYYTLTDELLAAAKVENIANSDMLSSDEIKVKDIIFKPSTIAYTNNPIEVMIKIPVSATVNSVTTTNDKSVNTETIQGKYKVYVVNQTSTDRTGNYEITVDYTYNEIQKTAKYEVTTFDNTKPTLNLTEVVNGNLRTVTITTDDNQSGIKSIKYDNQIVESTKHFKNSGYNIYNSQFKVESDSFYAIYIEDKAGNETLYNHVPEIWRNNVYAIQGGAPIPNGFVVSPYEGENLKSKGLVIYALTETEIENNVTDITIIDKEHKVSLETRNQFVWIPVDSKTFFTTDTQFKRTDYLNTESLISQTVGINYWELLLDDINMPSDNQGSNLVSQITLEEATEMYTSVKKYGGFYIGRYELGGDEVQEGTNFGRGNLSITKGKYPYNGAKWGATMTSEYLEDGAVTISRSMYTSRNNKYGAASTLTYGVQWDRTLDWIKSIKGEKFSLTNSINYGNYANTVLNVNDFATGAKFAIVGSNSNGWYVNQWQEATKYTGGAITCVVTTGSLELANLCNIYDMAGNLSEWTMEGYNAELHVYRGGDLVDDGNAYPIVRRTNSYGITSAHVARGFRPSLYIKLD